MTQQEQIRRMRLPGAATDAAHFLPLANAARLIAIDIDIERIYDPVTNLYVEYERV